MMRWNTFGRSVAFAAIGAAGVIPWLVLARPLVGADSALAGYLVLVTAGYLAGLAPQRRQSLAALLIATLVGCALATVARSWTELTLGLAAVLATGRSAFLYRASSARAAVIEAVLVGTGLLFARFLAGPSPRALMLALWGFLLVQSVYFLVAGVRMREPSGRRRDPFEEAYDRAVGLLEH